jgi:hypothetical protein
MGASDSYSESLLEALARAGISSQNHDFIQKFTMTVGIAGYRVVQSSDKPYVKARRRDSLPDLHIHWGYTNGFVSDDDAVRAVGPGVERAPSSRKGTWYVAHPVTKVRPGSPRAADKRREAGYCECGMQKSLTGVCASCD